MLDWFDRLDREAAYALLEQWPTLQEWQKVSAAKLRMFFRKHHCRDQEVIERRIVGIRQAVPAMLDRAVIEAKSAVVKVIAQLIRILVQGIAELDRKIEEGAAAHPDFFIFDSLPGAGPALAPRLLAAFGSQRGRYGSAQEVQAYSGIAPVIERSEVGFDPITTEVQAWDHKAYYAGAHKLRVRVTGDRSGRLLGAQIVGNWQAQVAKRIDIFATALFAGMNVDEISDLDLSYTPPLSSP